MLGQIHTCSANDDDNADADAEVTANRSRELAQSQMRVLDHGSARS